MIHLQKHPFTVLQVQICQAYRFIYLGEAFCKSWIYNHSFKSYCQMTYKQYNWPSLPTLGHH